MIIILAGFFSYRVKIKNLWLFLTKEQIPAALDFNKDKFPSSSAQPTSNLKTNVTNQPLSNLAQQTSFNLNVPFTSQAPFADWNETFKEACEEASLLMADAFYKNKNLTAEAAAEEILKMVEWQNKNFGGHYDLTVEQTAQVAKEYLGYQKIELLVDPTIEQIKKLLDQKLPVIVPAAGRELNNPYFRNPGPVYHMLLIKGYTENKFITNDPGTKRGQDYLYDYQTIMEATHDWNGENAIGQGAKRVLVIYPRTTF